MQPYKPSNIVPFTGLLILIVAAIIGGAAVGILVSFVERLVYLIILFPILMGLAGGFILANAIRLGKVRNPLVGAIFGVVIGILIYGSYHFAGYLNFREEVKTMILEDAGITAADILPEDWVYLDEFIDTFLEEEYGQPGFLGYMMLAAEEGVSISPMTSSNDKGINLGQTGTWIYWVVELLIIVGIALVGGRNAALNPYCENCDQWMEKEKLIGTLPTASGGLAAMLAKQGDFRQLGESLALEPLPIPHIGVYVSACARNCMSGARLLVKSSHLNNKHQVVHSVQADGMLTAAQYNDLNYGLRRRVESGPVESGTPQEEPPSA